MSDILLTYHCWDAHSSVWRAEADGDQIHTLIDWYWLYWRYGSLDRQGAQHGQSRVGKTWYRSDRTGSFGKVEICRYELRYALKFAKMPLMFFIIIIIITLWKKLTLWIWKRSSFSSLNRSPLTKPKYCSSYNISIMYYTEHSTINW